MHGVRGATGGYPPSGRGRAYGSDIPKPVGEHERVASQLDQCAHVVLGVVSPVLLDAPVPTEAGQLEVRNRKVESLRQQAGAQARVHRESMPDPGRFVREEVPVEPSVVRHDHAPAQHLVDARCNVGILRRAPEPRSGDAVDLDRPGVALGSITVDHWFVTTPFGSIWAMAT